jgi:arabinofuranosyltransferase
VSSSVVARADFDGASRRWIVAGASLAFVILLIRTAWVCDDAYITFRTVMNFLHGYGLRWNIVNRVQSFTHPLWMFVMTVAAGVTREVYFTSILLSIALTVMVVALMMVRVASALPMALFAVSALAVSKSFVDYSTSGLENALTHLLLVLFFLTCFSQQRGGRRIGILSLLASLLMLNRLDLCVLVLPVLAVETWRARGSRPWLMLVLGMLPLIAWECFAFVYYGFLAPNTAYAKLAPGIPRTELLRQGVLYVFDSLDHDPVTLLVILTGAAAPLFRFGSWPVSIGITLYTALVVWAGGDFMSGRFFAAPFLCALIQLVRLPVARRFSVGWAAAFASIWLAGLAVPRPTILSAADFGDIETEEKAIPSSHITDERRFYYSHTGLLTAHRGVPMPDHRWLHVGEFDLRIHLGVTVVGPAGFVGYVAGPATHIIDWYGLGDPLLARLPAEVPWQIGHFQRKLPRGYTETVANRKNLLEDPGVAAYYDRLRIITEDPIWSRRRFRTILSMNLGRYERFIASYGVKTLSLDDLSANRISGTEWNAPGTTTLTLKGALIRAGSMRRGGTVEMSVSGNDRYRVTFLNGGQQVGTRQIEQPLSIDGSLRVHTITLAPNLSWDAISVAPSAGDSLYSVGHIRLVP